jgi:hypothetical protein
MRSSTPDSNPGPGAGVDARWRSVFDDRYGAGGLDRLLTVFGEPCVTFAEIAERFGVTRERVRQWHLQLMPGAPRGHERQRLCRLSRQKRELLRDPLFRAFYANVRRHFAPGQLSLVSARSGFRRRVVRLHQRVVLIREAPRAPRKPSAPIYTLRAAGDSEFVYYRLSGDDFLFVPRSVLPPSGTTFIDNGRSRYRRFKNSFAAAFARAVAVPTTERERDQRMAHVEAIHG